MKRLIFLIATLAAGAASAQDAALVKQGEIAFTYSCAPCHGNGPGNDGAKMLPGTASLTMKYKGAKPALLEQRTDLPVPVLRVFVRNGSFSMPAFRKTELSDADIVAIAAYLQAASKKP
ncbi:MAG: cytochrome c [Caulobacteraceae bacterium]